MILLHFIREDNQLFAIPYFSSIFIMFLCVFPTNTQKWDNINMSVIMCQALL